jgi:tRNA modification GTPase
MAGPVLQRLVKELEAALHLSSQNAAIRSGLRLVIAGAPNVGKSSLLNALAGREAAIVSAQAGTTRDVVEAQILFEGVPLALADTAGLRSSTSDAIEKIGMARAEQAALDADLLLWVMAPDVVETVGPPRRPDLIVHNKSDLGSIRTRNDVDQNRCWFESLAGGTAETDSCAARRRGRCRCGAPAPCSSGSRIDSAPQQMP